MSRKNESNSLDARGVSKDSFQGEISAAKEQLRLEQGLNQILGQSPLIRDVREKIKKIADCEVSVLIVGESGTGKELVARSIHYLSPRAGRAFVPVNCGAIPETLFDNELFGHAKGAYTDAKFSQVGLLEEAEGGTIFLDEISAVSPYVQVKLLRLLQDKEFRPLGDTKFQKADVRFVVATNTDLQGLMKQGVFREDLYYRLNIVSLHLPPLRERKEDIPILVDHFLAKYGREYRKPGRGLSPEAMEAFLARPWEGNVRELENKIQELVVMSTSPLIGIEALSAWTQREPARPANTSETFRDAKKRIVEAFEKSYLIQLLADVRGDVAQAARCAGKSRTSLWNYVKKYSLNPRDYRSS